MVKTSDELVLGLRQLIFGPNDIIVPNHSIGYLLVMEVLNPFYIFQVASVILWTSDEYYYYAAAIVLMSVSGIVSSVYQTKQVRYELPTAEILGGKKLMLYKYVLIIIFFFLFIKDGFFFLN